MNFVPEGNKYLRRPRHAWDDDIKINLTKLVVYRCELNSSVSG
jgi:hypothetical protein